MMRSTLSTFTKHTIGRVLRRTSTKQRSITLVVRSLRHRCRGKAKNDSNSGKSCSSRRTTAPYCRRQRAPKLRKAVSASALPPDKWPALRSSLPHGLTSALSPGCCASYAPSNADVVPADTPSESPPPRSEEHTSELQSRLHLVCRLLLEKKKEHWPGGEESVG